jgi:hypothetical protein
VKETGEREMGWEFDAEGYLTRVVPAAEETRDADPVNSPEHYTFGAIETIDYLRAKLTPEEFAGFCRGNVLKYVSRTTHKHGVEDLRKAAWYLDRLIANMEEVSE